MSIQTRYWGTHLEFVLWVYRGHFRRILLYPLEKRIVFGWLIGVRVEARKRSGDDRLVVDVDIYHQKAPFWSTKWDLKGKRTGNEHPKAAQKGVEAALCGF